jgi:hypothetical protein
LCGTKIQLLALQEKKEVFKEELDMDLKPTALADVPCMVWRFDVPTYFC